jgi:hypothetical protein
MSTKIARNDKSAGTWDKRIEKISAKSFITVEKYSVRRRFEGRRLKKKLK